MPRRSNRVPGYRLHKPSGQAVVTLGGKDYYLGPHGSPASRAAYGRLIAEWESRGRRQADPSVPGRDKGVPGAAASDMTVKELILAYWRFAEGHYRKGGRP